MSIIPSYVFLNPDAPPELELKFVCTPENGKPIDEWENWCLPFVAAQLYWKCLQSGALGVHAHPHRGTQKWFEDYHMSFARKCGWRSPKHMQRYFQKCSDVVAEWRSLGPQLLSPETRPGKPGSVVGAMAHGSKAGLSETEAPHGLYLWNVRNEVCDYFAPNFFPPYNTPEKRETIQSVLFPDEPCVPPPTWLSKDPTTTNGASTFHVVGDEPSAAPTTEGPSATSLL